MFMAEYFIPGKGGSNTLNKHTVGCLSIEGCVDAALASFR
jgi:hypothetical protein